MVMNSNNFGNFRNSGIPIELSLYTTSVFSDFLFMVSRYMIALWLILKSLLVNMYEQLQFN